MRIICASLICLLFLPACLRRAETGVNADTVDNPRIEEPSAADPVQIRAMEIASSLDDRLLAAQVLICGIDGKGTLPIHIKILLEEIPAGGIMLFRYNLDTDSGSTRTFLGETASLVTGVSGVPPFIAVDHEGGTVNRFPRGVASLPAAHSYWEFFLKEGRSAALSKIEADSLRAGREINSLGINLNFAPVAEFIFSGNRDFLESRSYGPDPVFTAEAAAAFIRGMEQAEVLCVVKHFPGSTGPDPHYSASVITGDAEILANLVYPFAELVKNGARAVMVAHTAVPSVDSEIASLSSVVMGDWLRGGLGFDGIIISDDFTMAAAGGAKSEEATIRSIAAGADMVLVWPSDLRRTHRAFVSALEDGRLSRERLRDAAARVIYEKLRMGLIEVKNEK